MRGTVFIGHGIGRLLQTFMYIATAVLVSCGQVAAALAAPVKSTKEIGIATSGTLLRMDDKSLDARLTDMERLGVKWIRVDFSWPYIQPDNSTTYNWKMYDRLVRVASIHHMKVLAMLAYTPPWAQEPRCRVLVITKAAGTKCNPRDNKIFARFARAAAIRYKHTAVRAWEIWNEPNLSAYWKTAQTGSTAVHMDARAYAAAANAAATEIRHNDPDGRIITGGLGPMFEPKYPKGMRQSDYLRQLLPHLQPALFDGVGIHPYSWPALPGKVALYNAFHTVDNGSLKYDLREIMTRAGWGNKQLWGTEYGATTKGLSKVTIPTLHARPDHVTEAMQSQIIAQGIREWYKKSNVGPLFVHADSDQWLPERKNEGGFGLRRRDGSKKPAYAAFQVAARALR